MNESFYHTPVMLNEVIDALRVKRDGIYFDGTLGGGGHSLAIMQAGGKVIATDLDSDATEYASKRFDYAGMGGRYKIVHDNFKNFTDITDELIPRFSYSAYCIDYPREKLYERIDKRVDKMIACGLVEEVKKLIEAGVTYKNQCMQGIGYKETYAYLTGKCTLEEAADAIKLNTRHYAKRQITFFKKLPGLVFLQPDLPEINAKRIVKQWI